MAILNDVIDITSITIKPQRNDEIEGMGTGQLLRAELSTPLWSIEINTPIMEFDDGRQFRAILNDLNRPGQVFDLYDPIGPYPRNDPNGTVIGSNVISVLNVDDDTGEVNFSGFPSGYKLSPGDYFQVDFSGIRGFFEVSEQATATSGGLLGPVRVFPNPGNIPPATVANFKKPLMRCQVMPDPSYGTVDSANWKMGGFTIQAIQKL